MSDENDFFELFSQYRSYYRNRQERNNYKIILFDLDGVLADLTHRLHYVTPEDEFNASYYGFKPDWAAFFRETKKDTPIWPWINLCRTLHEQYYRIYIITGRSEETRIDTFEWLSTYTIPCDFVFMRPAKNYEPDYIIKEKILKEIITTETKERILFAIDDHLPNIEIYKKYYIPTLYVPFKEYNYTYINEVK